MFIKIVPTNAGTSATCYSLLMIVQAQVRTQTSAAKAVSAECCDNPERTVLPTFFYNQTSRARPLFV